MKRKTNKLSGFFTYVLLIGTLVLIVGIIILIPISLYQLITEHRVPAVFNWLFFLILCIGLFKKYEHRTCKKLFEKFFNVRIKRIYECADDIGNTQIKWVEVLFLKDLTEGEVYKIRYKARKYGIISFEDAVFHGNMHTKFDTVNNKLSKENNPIRKADHIILIETTFHDLYQHLVRLNKKKTEIISLD